MRVMVIVKATASSEASKMPSAELIDAMDQFNKELADAGILVMADGLHPTNKAVRVHFSGKNRSITKGPFKNITETPAGFWIWEVQSMEEAIEWVKRCPNPMMEDSDIDIRPIMSMEDFLEATSANAD